MLALALATGVSLDGQLGPEGEGLPLEALASWCAVTPAELLELVDRLTATDSWAVADGVYLFLGAPVRDAAGQLAYFFASQVDVTLERERLSGLESRNAALLAELSDRLRAQAASEARLRFATEAGQLGVWELDLRTQALVTSRICRQHFGRDPIAPFTYAELRAVIHVDDCRRMDDAVARSIATGDDYNIEYRVGRSNGSAGWVEVRAQVVRTSDGTPLHMAGTSLDITERKQVEVRTRALLELDDRLRTLDEPAELAFAAAEVLGRTLDVSRAGYGTVDPRAETISIERDWNAPGIESLVEARQVLTPEDLETTFGTSGGHVLHGEPALDQLLWMRPIPALARYRTPIAGLYLCGTGVHPGGGVGGAPGANAARTVLRDRAWLNAGR